MDESNCTKTCTRCCQTLPLDVFYKNRLGRYGRDSRCKDCRRIEAHERRDSIRSIKNRYYERNREKIRERECRKPYDPADYQKAKAKHGHKIAARNAVNMAIRRGELLRASARTCVDCGEQARHYDHVNGYEKGERLNVEPVCTICHGKRARLRDEYRKMQ